MGQGSIVETSEQSSQEKQRENNTTNTESQKKKKTNKPMSFACNRPRELHVDWIPKIMIIALSLVKLFLIKMPKFVKSETFPSSEFFPFADMQPGISQENFLTDSAGNRMRVASVSFDMSANETMNKVGTKTVHESVWPREDALCSCLVGYAV